MKTKTTLRSNLDALRPSIKKTGQATLKKEASPPDQQPPKKARSLGKKRRNGPGAGHALEKKAATAPARSVALTEKGDDALIDNALASRGEFAAAYARVLPEIDALPREGVRRINVNVPSAAKIALGARPKLLALRDALRAKLIDAPDEAIERLRDYALAAVHAYARVLLHDEGETRVRALLNEAVPLRERMLSTASNLATFGLFDPIEVAAIRQGTGHLDTVNDLLALGTLFHEAGPELLAKTPLTRADIERATELGELLLEALGLREQGTDGSGEAREAEERLAKAYELLYRAYDECRRAVTYLRWREGDADEIVPSLLQSRRRTRRSPPDEPDGGEPAPEAPGGEADAG
jgi:hypothetical protein